MYWAKSGTKTAPTPLFRLYFIVLYFCCFVNDLQCHPVINLTNLYNPPPCVVARDGRSARIPAGHALGYHPFGTMNSKKASLTVHTIRKPSVVGADVLDSPPCINKSLCNEKCSLCPLGASRTSPPIDGGLTLSLSIAKMQLMQATCQKPAQIPLRHDTGDAPLYHALRHDGADSTHQAFFLTSLCIYDIIGTEKRPCAFGYKKFLEAAMLSRTGVEPNCPSTMHFRIFQRAFSRKICILLRKITPKSIKNAFADGCEQF